MQVSKIRSKWMGVKSFYWYNNRIIYVIPPAFESSNGFLKYKRLKKTSYACSLLHWVFIWKTPCLVNDFLKNNNNPVWNRGKKWILCDFLPRNFYSSFGEIFFPVIKLILCFLQYSDNSLWCYSLLWFSSSISNVMLKLSSDFIFLF